MIEIIRTEEEPGRVMMERFNITETQAEAILELKLRHLAKLEEFKLRAEQNELAEERDKLERSWVPSAVSAHCSKRSWRTPRSTAMIAAPAGGACHRRGP